MNSRDKGQRIEIWQRDKLEAENAELLSELKLARELKREYWKQRNEARYWARRERRRYLHVKANIMSRVGYLHRVWLYWLPEDDPDYIPF